MASKHKFHKGDRVEWSAGSGTTTGIVKEFITEDCKVDGNPVSASKDDPRYLVENDNTGNVTGHKPETLSHSSSQSEGGSDTDLSDAASNSAGNTSGGFSTSFSEGDQVRWNTSQGKTTGTVKKKLTAPTDIQGYTAEASEDEPQYLVESDSTGSEAAHRPGALEEVG